MRKTSWLMISGLLTLLLVLAAACGGSDDSDVPAPGNQDFQQMLVTQLRSQGMDVSVGYPKLWTAADCVYNYQAFHSCFGNNPASPYVLPIVKSWPEEYVDPALKDGFGPTLSGYSATYRLDPTEAIVVYGKMPPKARYLGLQSWVFTTGYLSDGMSWNAEAYSKFAELAGPLVQYLFGTIPGNQSRVLSFSSFDNNVNNVVMANQSGVPWEQIRYLLRCLTRLNEHGTWSRLLHLCAERRTHLVLITRSRSFLYHVWIVILIGLLSFVLLVEDKKSIPVKQELANGLIHSFDLFLIGTCISHPDLPIVSTQREMRWKN